MASDPTDSNTTSSGPLLSEFADDPDMADLVDMFVADLPQRVQVLTDAVANSDAEELARLAHQLKGSAGGYGFMPITESAAIAEKLAKEGANADMASLTRAVADLVNLCERAMAGAES